MEFMIPTSIDQLQEPSEDHLVCTSFTDVSALSPSKSTELAERE